MQLEQIKISDLRPHPKNYNKHPEHQIVELAKSFKRFKQFKNIVVDENNTILAGHGLVEVLQRLGIKTVDAERMVGLSEDDKVALLAADNLTASLAEPDTNLLAELLSGLESPVDVPGVTDALLAELGIDISGGESGEGLTDADEIPEPTESICKSGDLWQLGNHRLLCGDCTDAGNVERLMQGEKANMVFVDPPYGIKLKYVGCMANNTNGKIQNDDKIFDPTFLLNKFSKSIFYFFGADYYIEKLPNRKNLCIWAKSHSEKENDVFGASFESFWRSKPSSRDIWYEKRIAHTGENLKEHPTQKPLSVIERCIKESNGLIIFDPFGGSGTTMIACEKLNRKARLMEIDEHYCDVIITRWENHTGQKAVKI